MKICLVGGCGKPLLAKGLCGMHYARKRTTGSTELLRPVVRYESHVCAFPGCARVGPLAKALCSKHYQRLIRRGSPSAVHFNWLPLEARFLARVNKDGPMQSHMDTSCWEWIGAKVANGYGHLQDKRRTLPAHRVSYELYVAPINDGLFVLHKCDNPSCVNPDHLFLGTAKQNSEDMVRKDRHARGTRNPVAKLTEEIVALIRASETHNQEFAIACGVSVSTIERARRGETWRHV